MENNLGIPLFMRHNVTLSAFIEARIGPSKGVNTLLYVTISTRIEGGIVANGEMVSGSYGLAGKVGHILVRQGERKCNIGCHGCFTITGDSTALTVTYKVIETIGWGVSSLLSIFDPANIYLGGGVAEGLRPLWSDVEQAIRKVTLPRYTL